MPVIHNPLFEQIYCPECGCRALYDPQAHSVPYIYTGTLDDDAPYIVSTMFLECRACDECFDGRISRYVWGPFDGSVAFEDRRVTYEGSSTPESLVVSLKPSRYVKGQLKLSATQQNDYTAVETALREQDQATVLRLLAGLSDVPSRKLWAWLRAAVHYGLTDILREWLPRMPDQDEKLLKKTAVHAVRSLQPGSFTALIEGGSPPILEFGSAINLYDPYLGQERAVGNTIEWAIILGATELAKRLIPLRQSVWLTTVFFYAIQADQQELIPLFLAQGCSGTRAIAHFIRQNKPECVQRLLIAGCDLFGVVYRKTNGIWVEETNLHVAARHGMEWLVEYWLQTRPNISQIVATDGTTPLQEAIENQHFSIAELLVQQGSPPEVYDSNSL